MPQVYDSIDSVDIIDVLRSWGYGIDSCHGYAFRLAVRSKTNLSKETGLGFWEPIGGIVVKDLREIQVTSRDAVHAAKRVEAICTGRAATPADTADNPKTDAATILHAVDNRIDAKLDAALAPVTKALQLVMEAVGAKTQPVVEAPEPEPEPEAPKKKRGWPKGKPRGPRKKKPAPEAAAQ